jgi:hypothetical protein
VLTLRAHHRLADEDILSFEGLVSAQAEVDLVCDRYVERIALDRRAMCTGPRLQRRKPSRVHSGRGAGKRVGAKCSVTRAVDRQPSIARESPGAAYEHTDADPFALRVRRPLDSPVLRRYELFALEHDPRVRVLRTRPGRGVDPGCAEASHQRREVRSLRSHNGFAPNMSIVTVASEAGQSPASRRKVPRTSEA